MKNNKVIQTVPDTGYDKILTQENKANWVNKALSLNVDPNHVIFVPHMFERLSVDLNGTERSTQNCSICYSYEWVHKHFQSQKDIPRLDPEKIKLDKQAQRLNKAIENNQDLDEESKEELRQRVLRSLLK